MNDTTVWCQNPSVTEPQRDGGGEADGEGAFKQMGEFMRDAGKV